MDKKTLFRRHGHPPAGTGLKERIHGAQSSKLSRRRQIRIRTSGDSEYREGEAGKQGAGRVKRADGVGRAREEEQEPEDGFFA